MHVQPMTNSNNSSSIYQESLDFHKMEPKGKIGIELTKPLNNQHDLSLAYSPGVAAPCLEIHKDPSKVFDYTSKSNLVAVISNGTAVLGLGNLGAKASIPVMEGKAALFKRFADIDSYDIVVDTQDPQEFITVVKNIGGTLGGINLEDISAPECFIIERELKKIMDIPVFHDDQHGTAIITAAGLINAAKITERKLEDIKVVVNGAGAAAIACVELIKLMGIKNENVILCDTKGTIYKGRTEGMNEWKAAHAVETNARTLKEALVGADLFLGLSVKGAVTPDMVKDMAPRPMIFAMANPDPEITPEEVHAVRGDAIVATGRSDYPNQVNNVMGFPYIFRGALDVQATTINNEMKIAAAHAIAELATLDVPESVSAAYSGRKLKFGPQYIIPTPFDPRLISEVPLAVAKAAMDTGVARNPITDIAAYRASLLGRLNPTLGMMNMHFNKLVSKPKKLIFTEGDDEQMVRAAVQWRNQGYGTPILIGQRENIIKKLDALGVSHDAIEINNAAENPNTSKFIDQLYKKLQRKGYLYRDCARMVKRDRNTFSALMLENGEADAMITGLTRSYMTCIDEVTQVIGIAEGKRLMGLSMILAKDHTIFVADTSITEIPSSEDLVEIAIQAANEVRALGHTPRVAFVSYSNFGNPMRERGERIRNAVKLMDERNDIDFEYDGEMQIEVALKPDNHKLYPFCRLTAKANILIMPALHSANISTQLLQILGGATVVGPILCGFEKPVQIMQLGAKESDIINLGVLSVSREF